MFQKLVHVSIMHTQMHCNMGYIHTTTHRQEAKVCVVVLVCIDK